MAGPQKLDWTELLALPIAQQVASHLSRRWNQAAPELLAREVPMVQQLVEEAAAAIQDRLTAAEDNTKDEVLPGDERDRFEATIGSCQPMRELYSMLDKIVASDTTVLITGENGTGKELIARAIHKGSQRKNQPFIVHNCSAFNDNLIDSELFGHLRGAFTGAVTDKEGLFDVADGGTFFLDEIGDMSPTLQVKVLRVLQEGTFIPVGGTETKHVDVRILAATNRDLPAMVAEGSFREDLYYRINVIHVELPPLRERPGDLEILARHFLTKHGGEDKMLSDECIDLLRRYAWPGNIRELENEMERLVVLAGEARELGPELISARIQSALRTGPVPPHPLSGSLPEALRDLEMRMIHCALIENHWNKTRTATQLQVSRRNLIRLVQKYELEPDPEAPPPAPRNN